jgi:hypothetical protein
MKTNELRTKLESMKLLRWYNDVWVDPDDGVIVVKDFEEDGDYPCVFVWMVNEDRAYSEDLSYPRGDDADDITSARQFSEWINSFYE